VTAFATPDFQVGCYERPRPDLTSNHGYGNSGVISGTTSTNFRTTNQGLKYKNFNFGLRETVKFEFRPIEIVRKLEGKSAKIRDEWLLQFSLIHSVWIRRSQTQSVVILAFQRHSGLKFVREQCKLLLQSASYRKCQAKQVVTFFCQRILATWK
jgi:hypothetical protein